MTDGAASPNRARFELSFSALNPQAYCLGAQGFLATHGFFGAQGLDTAFLTFFSSDFFATPALSAQGLATLGAHGLQGLAAVPAACAGTAPIIATARLVIRAAINFLVFMVHPFKNMKQQTLLQQLGCGNDGCNGP